jgi:drug/metabolite transporter (DMT)-like permease
MGPVTHPTMFPACWHSISIAIRYNYPNFLNLFGNFMYIPICFAYILPVSRFGWFNNAITPEQLALPKRPFAIMGALDCLAMSMQIFASIYLPGSLLVLLPQAAIPMSMVFSRYLLHEKYGVRQYLGAIVVLAGILIVLEPVITLRHSPDYYCEAINIHNDCTICQVEATQGACLSHKNEDPGAFLWAGNSSSLYDDDSINREGLCQWLPFDEASKDTEFLIFVWSLVMIASCVPMTLSTVYKQIALGDGTDLDPVYLNGWIAVFQFCFSLVLAFPAGMSSSPSVQPLDLPKNVWDGIRCYMGHGTVETGCHPDSMCSFHAALFVNVCLICNLFYSFFMMFVLKYGSSDLLFLALTVMVPIGNIAFALPFMPESQPMHASDLVALAVIMSGLVLYRFSGGKLEEPHHADAAGDNTVPGAGDNHDKTWRHIIDDLLHEPLIMTGDV